jgi:hypothetical protein
METTTKVNAIQQMEGVETWSQRVPSLHDLGP